MPFWHPNQLGRSPNLQITAESMKSISGELWFANNPRTNVLSVNRSHVRHLRLSFGSFGLIYDIHCYWGLQAVQPQTGQSCTQNMDITGLLGMAHFQFFFWSITHTHQWLMKPLMKPSDMALSYSYEPWLDISKWYSEVCCGVLPFYFCFWICLCPSPWKTHTAAARQSSSASCCHQQRKVKMHSFIFDFWKPVIPHVEVCKVSLAWCLAALGIKGQRLREWQKENAGLRVAYVGLFILLFLTYVEHISNKLCIYYLSKSR